MVKREEYLDATKALAMFLVILGHIIVVYDNREYAAPVARVIYSFHTALFMFVSGWFFSNVLKKGVKDVIISKSRQLMLPYFTWSVIVLLLQLIPESNFDVSTCLKDFILGGVFRNYWYIKLLFIFILLTYVAVKLIKNKWVACFIVWLAVTLLPQFSFSGIFIPFFLSAFMLRNFIEKHDNWVWISGYAIVAILLYSFWTPSCNYTEYNMGVVPYFIRTLLGIDMSCLIIMLLKKLFKYVKGNNGLMKYMAYTGTITLGMYVAHFVFYAKVLWGWILDLLPQNQIFIYIVFAIVVYVETAFLISIIKKNKRLAFVFLGLK